MIYPEDFEQKLSFHKIREQLLGFCLSDLGRELVSKITGQKRLSKISLLLDQTVEMKGILEEELKFPQSDYYNLIPVFERIGPKGSFIELEELPELKDSLHTLSKIRLFFENDIEQQFVTLGKLCEGIDISVEEIRQLLDKILDDDGSIKSNASKKLSEIRKQIRQKENSITSSLRKIFSKAKEEGIIDPNSDMTIRNGRLVIPVPASHKRSLSGFIHDQSATGQTVFIEPAEIFEGNNELLQLLNDEKRELIRILQEFTDEVRFHRSELIHSYRILGALDFIRAKARLAQQFSCVKPSFKPKSGFKWFNARHPLLQQNLALEKKEIVPLSISLDNSKPLLIISGPNAGGKSVALKTVALIQYMYQCGLLVPVDAHSEFCIFDEILIDIGDQQSIEKDLSTYSSHLLNMKYFLEKAGPDTIILIDEFGTGTDPQLGGAIAQAILEDFIEKKTFGIITTHYSNIKKLGTTNATLQNAAMLFDQENFSPLFQMIPGQPGHSYAFAIAQKSGINSSIIEKAEQYAGKTQVDYEEQLNDLKTKLLKLEEDQKRIDFTDDVLDQTLKEYQDKLATLKSQEKNILTKAKSEASLIIKQANKRIEQTIREIKEANAEKEDTKRIRKQLDEEADSIIPKSDQQAKTKKSKPTLKIGDTVRIKESGTVATIIKINNNKILIETSHLKMEVDKELLEKTNAIVQQKKQAKSRQKSVYHDLNKKAADFYPVIDVRGKNSDEAIAIVDKFIDDAILLSVKELRIIHGKGNGILRRNIRAHLEPNREISTILDENPQFGGDGISLIKLK